MVANKLIYRGPPRQMGHGLPSLIGSLFRHLVPALSSGVKAAAQSGTVRRLAKAGAKAALKTGVGAIKDATAGKNVKAGMKTNLRSAKKRLAEAALGNNITCTAKKKRTNSRPKNPTNSRPKKLTNSKKHKNKKKRTNKNSIF